MNWQESNAEDELRGKWQRRIVEHGESTCPDCVHSGWTHGINGCSAFRSDTPSHIEVIGKTSISIVDIPDDKKMEDYFCGCKGNLCKTNAEIIGVHETPVYNEPLSYYEGR